jgi:hypothetical protein
MLNSAFLALNYNLNCVEFANNRKKRKCPCCLSEKSKSFNNISGDQLMVRVSSKGFFENLVLSNEYPSIHSVPAGI